MFSASYLSEYKLVSMLVIKSLAAERSGPAYIAVVRLTHLVPLRIPYTETVRLLLHRIGCSCKKYQIHYLPQYSTQYCRKHCCFYFSPLIPSERERQCSTPFTSVSQILTPSATSETTSATRSQCKIFWQFNSSECVASYLDSLPPEPWLHCS